MAYQVLARKWRPKQFEDVVGQEHVTRTLQNAIKNNRLAHAYLFTGTRGVGKTSIARLFSKAIRCEDPRPDFNPCLQCLSCKEIDLGSSLDYIEIDGASNNSVEGVRALIENVQYLPSRGRFKIYVIDEVHMLSNSAFNALLKTLEEPPSHVIFILATTDPHKLLGTVLSRCQRYDFKHVPVEKLKNHIESIANKEKIEFADETLSRKIATLGKGSVRDSLSILDQVISLTENHVITDEIFSQALGLIGDAGLKKVLNTIFSQDVRECSLLYNSFIERNIDIRKFCDQILESLFIILNNLDSLDVIEVKNIVNEKLVKDLSVAEIYWIYEVLAKDFQWGLSSINPERVILVILQKVCLRRQILAESNNKISEFQKARTQIQMEVKKFQPKSWEDFLSFIKKESPTTAVNLEHGNLLTNLVHENERLQIDLGFMEDAQVFKEYLEQKEIYQRLLGSLAHFFQTNPAKIVFKISLLKQEEKDEKKFKSRLEIDEDEKKRILEERKQKILDDPYIREAEKIFNSRIDKIILKD
jgi:DNA polymerase-3 subunit gamma/tau